MPKLQLKQGTTSKTVLVFVRDTGPGLDRLLFRRTSSAAPVNERVS